MPFVPLNIVPTSDSFAPMPNSLPLSLPLSLSPSLLPVPSASPLPFKPATAAALPVQLDAAKSQPAMHYSGFFDGAAQPAEGSPVTPRDASSDYTYRRPLQLSAVEGAVQRALPSLRESVSLGRWNGPRTTLDESCCGDAAPKLALLLRAQGVPARLVEAELHFYIILDLPDGLIIVDPTVRQFFGKKHAPKSIPQVFIGTPSELETLFTRHSGSRTVRDEPSRIYFKDAVVREDALRVLESSIRSGSLSEHEPLRRFLAR
jgi:hypothetical protein